MISVTVTMPQLEPFAGAIDGMAALVEEAEAQAMQKAVLYVEAEAKVRVPRVTGRLFASLHGEVTSVANPIRGIVATPVQYAPYVEFGRGPIVARNAKALRFKINGHWVYRKRVGPAKAKPYLAPALEGSIGAVRGFFRDAIQGVFRRVSDATR